MRKRPTYYSRLAMEHSHPSIPEYSPIQIQDEQKNENRLPQINVNSINQAHSLDTNPMLRKSRSPDLLNGYGINSNIANSGSRNLRSNRGDGAIIANMQKQISSYYMSPINI